jgi:ABC-type iron transport system FetAB permease component
MSPVTFKLVIAHVHAIEFSRENRDKIEIYLAFGATRVEASRPVARQALKLALTPPINNMR